MKEQNKGFLKVYVHMVLKYLFLFFLTFRLLSLSFLVHIL